ncbi:hypothetical protein KFL_002790025 [Klebsormidium nitens]|uniref:Uncharacterized protein n=1 Tax=Klebsormidium nitens TaxID=105231 RepID=A0A1Y1I6V5_KLENI|nr:hypothetical protein KFL_002790025 [Klebsormidium nitens]|eukprot:GAQ86253.1 hypothetical protein KFL_002790025 [Klebsormidium nitens]
MRFKVAIPGAPPTVPLAQPARAEAEQPTLPPQDPPQPAARRVAIPEAPTMTLGTAAVNALTPGFMRESDMVGSTARLERAFKEFVQKGSLIPHMEALLRKIPRDARSWHSKAKQLFESYKELDPKVAHLMAAVYFYATQLDFVSLDLEYMADGFVTDMKLAIEEAGDSSSWTAETVRLLEKKIKKDFEEYRKEAQGQIGEGNASPWSCAAREATVATRGTTSAAQAAGEEAPTRGRRTTATMTTGTSATTAHAEQIVEGFSVPRRTDADPRARAEGAMAERPRPPAPEFEPDKLQPGELPEEFETDLTSDPLVHSNPPQLDCCTHAFFARLEV